MAKKTRLSEMENKKFGKLLFIKEVEPYRYTKRVIRRAIFLCDCGGKITVSISSVKTGHTKSCGCIKHGMSKTREYRSWNGMRSRCNNKNGKSYKNYGGRGIKVCPRWDSFEKFIKDMGKCPAGKSLDRIDNNGNYEPSNCRWTSYEEQANNRRSNNLLTFKGKTRNIAFWAKETGINQRTIRSRVSQLGWTAEKALTKNTRKNRILFHNGKSMTLSQWASYVGIPKETLWSRLNRGWSAERALNYFV